MKKEIKQTLKNVKIVYGLEGAFDEEDKTSPESLPVLDLETQRHQRFTNRIMDLADYSGMAVIYGSLASYGVYKSVTKVPEVIDQLGLACSDIYQFIQPFISS